MKFRIRLENTQDAEEFVKAATMCGSDIDLHSGTVYIDGKSLLGVMAMGLKREMSCHVSAESDSAFQNAIKKFVVA
jgi:phosphotransferase system HPr-like phosphotransfer protein